MHLKRVDVSQESSLRETLIFCVSFCHETSHENMSMTWIISYCVSQGKDTRNAYLMMLIEKLGILRNFLLN